MYDPAISQPRLLLQAMGGAPGSQWLYSSEDLHTDVDATGYFTNGGNLGMKEGDLIFVVGPDGETTLHSVIDVEAPDPYRPAENAPFAASISAAAIVEAP
jgi:hypothetical protein